MTPGQSCGTCLYWQPQGPDGPPCAALQYRTAPLGADCGQACQLYQPRTCRTSLPPNPLDTPADTSLYHAIAAEIAALVTEKQAAYGDAFGKAGDVLRILYPSGIGPDQLDDALAIVRVVDKLFRIATDRDALRESPWRDIAGYALLSIERLARQEQGAQP